MQYSSEIDELKKMQRKIMMFEVFDTIIEIVILLVFFLSLQYFFVSPFIVSGASMERNLHNQEIILVNRMGFSKHIFNHMGSLQRGDVIVFRPPHEENEYYIKRVIGIPGDRIEFKDNVVYLNNEKLEERYTNCYFDTTSPQGSIPCRYPSFQTPIIVPQNSYFAMGDNRNFSADSRQCFRKIPLENCTPSASEMFVSYDSIVGTATAVFWPFNSDVATKQSRQASFLESFWPITNPRGIPRLDPALQKNGNNS